MLNFRGRSSWRRSIRIGPWSTVPVAPGDADPRHARYLARCFSKVRIMLISEAGCTNKKLSSFFRLNRADRFWMPRNTEPEVTKRREGRIKYAATRKNESTIFLFIPHITINNEGLSGTQQKIHNSPTCIVRKCQE